LWIWIVVDMRLKRLHARHKSMPRASRAKRAKRSNNGRHALLHASHRAFSPYAARPVTMLTDAPSEIREGQHSAALT
jgi:hypothetical protein